VKQIPPIDSLHQVDSDRWHFHPFMPALTLVSLLEQWTHNKTPSGVGNCHAAWRHLKTTVCTYIAYGCSHRLWIYEQKKSWRVKRRHWCH
jgi:hypothetical protein